MILSYSAEHLGCSNLIILETSSLQVGVNIILGRHLKGTGKVESSSVYAT